MKGWGPERSQLPRRQLMIVRELPAEPTKASEWSVHTRCSGALDRGSRDLPY